MFYEGIAYEDALNVLSFAAPYKVAISLVRGKNHLMPGSQDNVRVNDELFKSFLSVDNLRCNSFRKKIILDDIKLIGKAGIDTKIFTCYALHLV